ncbi:MAG: diacylglycerol kinase [Candidatus Kerfeldbacteria bacterium]|nr:diacylglycerol kinase [Candidatus Kerfeldbacteria bacterium]
MFNFKNQSQSFRYAVQGLRFVWQQEQNFRVQSFIAVLVIIAMILFRVTLGEAIILTMMIVFVLVLEVVNTIFEKFVDILKPRLHMYVGVIKDMMAAAVLLAACGAVAIALMVFIPYIVVQ